MRGLQEQVKSLQEQAERYNRVLESHTRSIEKLASKINALGTRWDIVTEETFRETIKYLIEDLPKGYNVGKWALFHALIVLKRLILPYCYIAI